MESSNTTRRGRGTKKMSAIGVKERSLNRVYAKVVLSNKEDKKLSGKQLFKILDTVCKDYTNIMIDDFKKHNILDYSKNYVYLSVNHFMGQYSAENGIHSNGIESSWALLKRGVYGINHHVSVKYLQSYLNEFCFRQTNKDDKDMFGILVKQCIMTK